MFYRYRVFDLGTLGGQDSSAQSINNAGVIAGTSATPLSPADATIWSAAAPGSPSTPSDIGVGFPAGSEASAINNLGVIVGSRFRPQGSGAGAAGVNVAAIWTGFTGQDLYSIADHRNGKALDINDSGWITGYASSPDVAVPHYAFLWRDPWDEYRLSVSPTESVGNAVNNYNLVVGFVKKESGQKQAVIWDYFAEHPMQSNLRGGDGDSVGNDINDNKTVAGFITENGKQRPVRWENYNKLVFLDGSFPIERGQATAINSTDQTVGFFSTKENGNEIFHAFLYDTMQTDFIKGPGGLVPITPAWPVMVDLNTLLPDNSGWQLEFAHDINDKGQIVGVGTHNGQRHAFRLDPIFKLVGHPHPIPLAPGIPLMVAEVVHLLNGIVDGSPGHVLGPHGVQPVPGRGPEINVIPILEMRIHLMIQDLSRILSECRSGYENRKKTIDNVDRFIATLREHKVGKGKEQLQEME